MGIPVHMVNGFLGSGKTTFLLHYLDIFAGKKRVGVVQNEFSSASVDGELIRNQSSAFQVLEVNNGSLFCVCLLGGFVASLSAFIDQYAPDEIIMEASGMSDPTGIGQIFQSPQLKNKVFLAHSWTLVDARNFHKINAIRARLEHQIRVADTVLINKCDIAGDLVEKVAQEVRRINPFANLLHCSYGAIEFTAKKIPFTFFPVMESTESCRPDLQSVVIKTNQIISYEKLIEFTLFVKMDFIRCKGFVNTLSDKKLAVQGIFDDYTFSDVDWYPGSTELVGIGKLNSSVNYTEVYESYCIH